MGNILILEPFSGKVYVVRLTEETESCRWSLEVICLIQMGHRIWRTAPGRDWERLLQNSATESGLEFVDLAKCDSDPEGDRQTGESPSRLKKPYRFVELNGIC